MWFPPIKLSPTPPAKRETVKIYKSRRRAVARVVRVRENCSRVLGGVCLGQSQVATINCRSHSSAHLGTFCASQFPEKEGTAAWFMDHGARFMDHGARSMDHGDTLVTSLE